MIQIVRTNSEDQNFIDLVKKLDAHLKIRDGDEHDFYNQFNQIESLQNVVVGYFNNKAVACGAFKKFDTTTVEIKRMYVSPEVRGRKFGTQIVTELESWAAQLSFKKCVLETGKRMPEAVGLYTNNGYVQIPNYGQYQGMDNSLCFEKNL